MRQTELIDRVKAYDPDVDEALLNKAYVYAMKGARQAVSRLRRSVFRPSFGSRRAF